MTEKHRCFVYGSLMRKMGNHRVLARARFIRTAHTAASFTLHDLGAYPGMIGGGTTRIFGEIYEVDDETLAALDRLERHPTFYRRKEIALSNGAQASAYLLPAARFGSYPIVVGGDWRAHLARERGNGHATRCKSSC
jgi:gamma-glutamylaminecyclotransferase